MRLLVLWPEYPQEEPHAHPHLIFLSLLLLQFTVESVALIVTQTYNRNAYIFIHHTKYTHTWFCFILHNTIHFPKMHVKHTMHFIDGTDSPSASANAHSHAHSHSLKTLMASQRGVLPPVWRGVRAAFPPDSEMYAIKPY